MSSPPKDTEPEPPEVVGGYRILHRLGGGGMGGIYEAEEPSIGRRVAVKILRRRFADDPEFVDRFQNEARLANSVKHPAIVDVFAFGKLEDGRPYFVMPLLEGASLRELLDVSGRLAPARSWAIVRDVAEALGAAHGSGLVHRDLKPDNVFLERARGGDRVRVMDFGIAKNVAGTGAAQAPRTQTGLLLGTPAYMAPEQWWGAKLDPRVDQYALGVMLHEMIRGEPPFDPNHESGVMKLHLHEPPPKLASFGVEVPAAAEALLQRLLAKEPGERFESMADVIAAGDAAFQQPTEGSDNSGAALAQTRPAEAAGHAATAPADAMGQAATVPAGASVQSTAVGQPSAYRNWLITHAAVLLACFGLTAAVGYTGSGRWQPMEWFRISGWAAYVVAIAYVAAALGMPLLARMRGGAARFRGVLRALALGPGLFGATGTYIGWAVVQSAVHRSDATLRFAVFNQGAYEAGANRFLGYGLAMGTCLSLAALQSLNEPTHVQAPWTGGRRLTAALATAVLAVGAIAGLTGAPSGVLVSGAALAFLVIVLLLPLSGEGGAPELERGVFGVLAVLFAVGAALERVAGRASILWSADTTRHARIQEILAASAEHSATVVISLGVLGIVLTTALLRLKQTRSLPKLAARHAVLVGAVILGIGLDVFLAQRFQAVGARTRKALEEQFALFAQLDPPSTDQLRLEEFAPRKGPALQIARSVVAVNGRQLARLASADTDEGRDLVKAALFKALAEEPEAPLSCLIDREVPWSTARRLLQIAHIAGARDAELLFTRGPSPRIPASGPAEVTYVQPQDFVAVPVRLGDQGHRLDAEQPFGGLASQLLTSAKARKRLRLPVASD